MPVMIQYPKIRGNAVATLPTSDFIGRRWKYPGTNCEIIGIKYDGATSVPCSVGCPVGRIAFATEAGSVPGTGTGNTKGGMTSDISRSSASLGVGITLNIFTGSTSSLRFGYALVGGELNDLNRALVRDGITSININGKSIAQGGWFGFGADVQVTSLAKTILSVGKVLGKSRTSITAAGVLINANLGGMQFGHG